MPGGWWKKPGRCWKGKRNDSRALGAGRDLLKTRAEQSSEEAAREAEESPEKMVKALGRKKRVLPNDYYAEENLGILPRTDILMDFFDREGYSNTVEPGFEIQVRWSLLCESIIIIPTACEALGHMVDCINEVFPLIWDLLES